MIKYIFILTNMLALVIVRMFFVADVTAKLDVPTNVKPGDEFTVSVVINKGSIAGVGHFKQELPAGFGNATAVDVKGGEFKYLPEDNVVKVTWISLPADGEFTISYKIKVDAAAANGNVSLGGKFSYVLDNAKQTADAPAITIQVAAEVMANATNTTQPETATTTPTEPEATTTKPDTTTTQPETTTTAETQPATTTTAQTETTAATTTSQSEKSLLNVSASRTIVGSPEAGMEFTVEVNVKKTGIKGFARIQESLPAGLTAIALENKGGTFSFLDQKVKIIWDNLPADEEVKISYRVSVADNVSGDMSISGIFSYVDNNDPMKAEIPSTSISVKAKSALAATNTQTNTSATNTTTTETQTQSNGVQTASTSTSVPSAEKKVAFKVQICALSKMQRDASFFQSKYNLGNKVNMEFHEGWRKYTVGKYSAYKDARDYRENVKGKGVENPFVTAYNNGKRVTVQEALMVSSQKWIP